MSEVYPKVLGIRFSPVNRVYHYSANGLDPKIGDSVVVETIRGKQIGIVAKIMTDFENEGEPLKPVERIATAGDLVSREIQNEKCPEAFETAQKKLAALGIKGVKILNVEFSFDGARLLVNYASENDEKVDLKALKYELQNAYPTLSNVDLRQLGPRDVAKTYKGMGACGLASRCCSRYLTEFSSISIKMAKEQGISLTPTEITGMCGRVRCCLVYENDYYAECRKNLPKKNARVNTPNGEGKVIEVFPLRSAVMVDLPEGGRREFTSDQITWGDAFVKPEKPEKEEKQGEKPERTKRPHHPESKTSGKNES